MARKPRQKPSLARRRADPGLRSRLPMSQLTPGQQASRRRNQQVAADDRNPLLDPTTQLAGHSLAAAAAQLADEQIKPKVDAFNRQITSATTQGTALSSRAGDYYKQLAQQAMGTVASQKALSDMLNAQTAQVGQQSQAAFGQMSADEQQRQGQDAALRGAGLGGDSSARVAGEIANDQGTAATLQQGSANQAAQTGSSWASLANAMSQAGQLRGQEVQGGLLNRLATQQAQGRQQIADVEATRGDETAKNLTSLRQQAYENLVTNQGLNIKQQDLQNQLANIQADAQTATANRTAADKRAAASIKSREKIAAAANTSRERAAATGRNAQGQKVNQYGYTNAEWQKMSVAQRQAVIKSFKPGGKNSSSSGGPKQATPQQQSTFRRDASSALAVANALKGKRQNRHAAAAALTTPSKQFPRGMDPLTASIALDVAYDGHISQYNVNRLHKAGISVSQLPWPTRLQAERRSRRSRLIGAAQQPGVRPLTPVNTLP
jgi:hypothetical protein